MALRRNLLELLAMGGARIGLGEALRNLRPADAICRPAATETGLQSAWELLEQMRSARAQLPHGQGRMCLRQVLLVADHNAYHLGQMFTVRQLRGLWQ